MCTELSQGDARPGGGPSDKVAQRSGHVLALQGCTPEQLRINSLRLRQQLRKRDRICAARQSSAARRQRLRLFLQPAQQQRINMPHHGSRPRNARYCARTGCSAPLHGGDKSGALGVGCVLPFTLQP